MNFSELTNSNSVIKKYDRTSPFSARLADRSLLTKDGSSKETYHVVLDTQDPTFTFKAGDSLGVYGQNCPKLVDAYLEALKTSGEEIILDPKSRTPSSLRHFLTNKANIGRSSKTLLQLLSTVCTKEQNRLEMLLQPGREEELKLFLQEHDPLDILRLFMPRDLPLQEFCHQFSPLLPRFYSIASSYKSAPNRIDLTIALSSYLHGNEKRFGVASYYLCKLAQLGSTIPIYVQPTVHFTLPADPQTPIIMIGPGTGVAPFRAFMQERKISGSPSKNWLFFGERNRRTDFFYEDFWNELCRQELLRLDVAFSRDQADKFYVQHLLMNNQASLWAWMQEGASVYVCGEAEKMAKSVEAAWLEIFQKQGNLSLEEAKAHLRLLKKEKRYLTDVY